MANGAQVIRYSPLGWGQWVYGPFFTFAGLVLAYIWQNEIFYTVANSGITVHSLADWFSAVLCPGSRCATWELAFSGVMWMLFLGVAIVMFGVGMLMMNVDRSTCIENGKLVTRRGNFFAWQKRSLSRADIARIDVAKVPVFMVMGNRVSKVGEKWRVAATLNTKGFTGKPKMIILAMEWREAEARAIAERCAV